jgi:hypothetical protein
MNFTLTWDLFVLMFFALVTTYTFIIGKKESVKIILGSYVGIVAVQALGNVIIRFWGFIAGFVGMSTAIDSTVLTIFKLIIFIAIVIILTVKSGYDIVYSGSMNVTAAVGITALLGFATAGLMLSTLLTYVANTPLLDMALSKQTTMAVIIQQSQLMQIMILHQDLWFFLPAVVLIGAGFAHKE